MTTKELLAEARGVLLIQSKDQLGVVTAIAQDLLLEGTETATLLAQAANYWAAGDLDSAGLERSVQTICANAITGALEQAQVAAKDIQDMRNRVMAFVTGILGAIKFA